MIFGNSGGGGKRALPIKRIGKPSGVHKPYTGNKSLGTNRGGYYGGTERQWGETTKQDTPTLEGKILWQSRLFPTYSPKKSREGIWFF